MPWIVHIKGVDNTGNLVIDEYVGPFDDGTLALEWLWGNGFDADSIFSFRDQPGYFHQLKICSSPLATKFSAHVVLFTNPATSKINNDPNGYK